MVKATGVVLATIVMWIVGAPAQAQDRLFIDGYEFGALGQFGAVLGPAPPHLDRRLIAGGRIAVRDADVIDLRTGATRPLPSGASVAAVDPALPRPILATPGPTFTSPVDLWVVDLVTGSQRPLATGVCAAREIGGPPAAAAYAYAAQVVVAARCDPSGAAQDLVAIHLTAHAANLRVVAPAPPTLSGLTVSADGRVLFARSSPAFLRDEIASFDIASGRPMGAATVAGYAGMQWDEVFERLFVIQGGGFADGRVIAFAADMAHLGTAPFTSRICAPRVQVSPHTERIYVTTDGASNTGARPVAIYAFAGQPLQQVGGTRLAGGVGRSSCAGAALRTAPGAPRQVRATVAGHDVQITWTNVGGASTFVLEAGIAPGRTDLTAFLGPDSEVTFGGVPAGTYYLRLRGANEFGGGRPSQEVRVVVP